MLYTSPDRVPLFYCFCQRHLAVLRLSLVPRLSSYGRRGVDYDILVQECLMRGVPLPEHEDVAVPEMILDLFGFANCGEACSQCCSGIRFGNCRIGLEYDSVCDRVTLTVAGAQPGELVTDAWPRRMKGLR